MKPAIILTTVITLLAGGCNQRTCNNKNIVFNTRPPESTEYKEELARQLKRYSPQSLSFRLDRYQQSGAKEYLSVIIEGNGICAKGMIEVKDWGKLAGIRASRGMGYSGAALKNLQIDIYRDGTKTNFLYKDVDAIID